MTTESTSVVQSVKRPPWNKDGLIGSKPPLKLKDIWAIRIHLQMTEHTRDLALFNLAIDSKLPGCDIVKLQVRDVAQNGRAASRAAVSKPSVISANRLRFFIGRQIAHLIFVKNCE